MNNHNMLFYSLRDPSSNEILSKVSMVPVKILKIPVEKYSNKIPSFVRQVPTLKLKDGNIFVGNQVLEWFNMFSRGNVQQRPQQNINQSPQERLQQNMPQNSQQSSDINNHGDVSAIYSKELTDFSDSYSFLTDNIDEKKVEQIKPIGHAYSFLDSESPANINLNNMSPQNTSQSGMNNNYKTNRSSGLDSALERMQQERMKDLGGNQRY